MEHNLWTLLEAIAARLPDRLAIIARDRQITYAELADRSRRLAHVLTAHGLGHHTDRSKLEPWQAGQDLAGLYMLNGPQYLEATFGSYAARVAPANINYRYVAEELKYVLNDARAGAIIYHARFAATLAAILPLLDRRPLLLQVSDDSAEALLPGALDYEAALRMAPDGPVQPLGGPHSPEDLYVLYTGGTTGMPKGTLWQQKDIYVAALGGDAHPQDADVTYIVEAATNREADAVLPIAPLMHAAAHWLSLRALLVGDTVVINDVVDRLDPVDVWSKVGQEHIVTMIMVGEAFARPLLDELERATYDTSSLRLVCVGGAATSAETKVRMKKLLPDTTIADIAGSSETGNALSAITARDDVGESGVFRPYPTVAVLDAERSTVVAPGHDGIGWFAKSGRLPLGYLGDEDKTAATFPIINGTRWSVPGDRARLRSDGLVELLGRDAVTINSGGEKIFAEEVEAAILTHPGVTDAIVVGRRSERWGQEVVVIISVEPGSEVADEEILETAGLRVARYKLPKAIIRTETVVRSPAGKADYAWARRVADGLLVEAHAAVDGVGALRRDETV